MKPSPMLGSFYQVGGVSKVERQLGVVRVVCGWFVHFLYKSVLRICVSETLEQG